MIDYESPERCFVESCRYCGLVMAHAGRSEPNSRVHVTYWQCLRCLAITRKVHDPTMVMRPAPIIWFVDDLTPDESQPIPPHSMWGISSWAPSRAALEAPSLEVAEQEVTEDLRAKARDASTEALLAYFEPEQ